MTIIFSSNCYENIVLVSLYGKTMLGVKLIICLGGHLETIHSVGDLN